MAPRSRESSEQSAARFIAARARQRASRQPSTGRQRPLASRIFVDFAAPTLCAIHEALCEQIARNQIGGDLLNLTLIAEQMVAAALGHAPCDDPPLTDREVRQ